MFRSLFPMGMTVFDPLEQDLLGGVPSMSHMSARQEYRSLVAALHLPTAEIAAAKPPEADRVNRFSHMAKSET